MRTARDNHPKAAVREARRTLDIVEQRAIRRERRERFRRVARRFLPLGLVFLVGCASHVVLVPPGGVVRLAKPVSATVATPDGKGGWSVAPNQVTLPGGWYVVPPPTSQP